MFRPWVFCNAILSLLLLLCAPHAAAQRRAVLVGINDYQSPSVRDLSGPHNDVASMRTLLVSRYGFRPENVTVLLDAQATHDAILDAIRTRLTVPSAHDDIALFYFSGHGSQMPDDSDDESDRLDETLVAWDSRTPGKFDVSDDELNAAFRALVARTPNITVILDSCHSGTGIRDVATVRRIDADRRMPPSGGAGPSARSTEGSDELLALGANYALLSGSSAMTLSNEDLFDDRIQGALTWAFIHAVSADRQGTYRSVFPEIVRRVQGRFPSQIPQLEGTGRDSPVFGIGAPLERAWVDAEKESSGRLRVLGGTLLGLRTGATLEVFAAGAGPLSGEPIGTLTLDRVELEKSSGAWHTAAPMPDRARARVDRVPYDGRARTVWLADDLPAPLRSALTSGAAEYPSLKLVPGEREADLRVFVLANYYAVLARDGSALSQSIETSATDAARRLLEQLHDWARWQSLSEMTNPDGTLQVRLSVRTLGAPAGSPAPASVPSGTAVQVDVENLSDETLHYALLNLTGTGRVKLLHPAAGAHDQLAPRASLRRVYQLVAPADRPAVIDLFKVIAATQPIDGSAFEQAAIRAAPNTGSALEQMIASRATARPRDALEYEIRDWTTAQVGVLATRESVALAKPRIALHFAEPAEPAAVVATLSAGTRSICPGDHGNDCATVTPLSRDGRIVEVTAPTLGATRSVGPGARAESVGQAFDDAYRAGESANADYAEPLLELRMPGPEEVPPGTRGGDGTPDPIAAGNDRWSLAYAGVPDAWGEVARVTGRAEARLAEGIVIGHPDTGYSQHPENWAGATPRAIDTDHDHDYCDDDEDAADPLLREGLIPNAGHGTGSGSVIVSPPGCQLSDEDRCVTGVAPGARLVPLRVHTSVAVFDSRALSRAIEDAATNRWGAKADVISIAMGGPPSRTLHKAVETAVAAGAIIVAAAGNYVRTVVWPARFDEVVAVSAINPRCEPWTHASHGRNVDFSAPGEGVWRASVAALSRPGDPPSYSNGMGAGTTFATGTTAGIAALWLAYHRDNPALAALRSNGAAADAFRAAAAASAWRPGDASRPPPTGVTCGSDRRWRPREYGEGVINAGALIRQPLPSAAPRALGAGALPLFSSLYEPAAPGRAAADYRSIFGGAALDAIERFETEVLFHYTTSNEVRDRIDRMIAAPAPGTGAVEVRNALRTQDISGRLRAALPSP
jgi:hypothetical protein